MAFIKLEPSNSATSNSTVFPKRTSSTYNGRDKSFYDIYAQQLLNTATNPVFQDPNSNGNSDIMLGLSNTQQTLPTQLPLPNSQSAIAAASVGPQDSTTAFGMMLGKKVVYFDAQANAQKEGVVKRVSLQNQAPSFLLEDGSIVRLEKVISYEK